MFTFLDKKKFKQSLNNQVGAMSKTIIAMSF